MYTPQPGDFFLSQIRGPLGFVIRLGQGLAGDWSRYTHAGIVLDDHTVMAAQPGGARIDTLESVLAFHPVAFSKNPLTDGQRSDIVAAARVLEGVPYSFLDYLSIVALAFGFKPTWLREWVANSGHMICSQLVDIVYESAGVCLFDDGRAPGDVTPGDLSHVGDIHHFDTGPYSSPVW